MPMIRRRLRFVILPATALMTVAPAQTFAQQKVFKGGPLSGIGVGSVARPDNGVRIEGLLPSSPNSSPISALDRPAIDALMRAFEHRDMTIVKEFLSPRAKQEQCAHGFYGGCTMLSSFDGLRVAEQCSFNTPYLLDNGRVRLEWLYKGVLWYWSEVELRAGKIERVRTHPADVPPQSPSSISG